MSSLEGKVIALTGAASGIGLETAKVLAARGAILSLADVQQEALEKVAASLKAEHPNIQLMVSAIDVRQNASVTDWIAKTVKTFGKLDGAANIAGIFRPAKPGQTVETESDQDWELTLSVNLTGVMQCMRAELPHMTKGGSIVNAASILAIMGSQGSAAYVASKHGVLGLTRTVAKEVGPKGIRVNCIAPGYVDTPMLQMSIEARGKDGLDAAVAGGWDNTPLRRKAHPSEMATVVAFLLSEDASYVTGQCISADGGLNC